MMPPKTRSSSRLDKEVNLQKDQVAEVTAQNKPKESHTYPSKDFPGWTVEKKFRTSDGYPYMYYYSEDGKTKLRSKEEVREHIRKEAPGQGSQDENDVAELGKQLVEANATCSALREEISTLKKSCSAQREEIRTLKKTCSAQREEISNLKKKLKAAEDRFQENNERFDDLVKMWKRGECEREREREALFEGDEGNCVLEGISMFINENDIIQ